MPAPPGNVHSAEDWRADLEAAIARCGERGVALHFRADAAFAKPEVYELRPEEVLLLKYESRYGHHKIGVAHLADRLTARAAKYPDFHALSLLSVFEDFSEMAYVDYVHLSPGANRHLAEELADYILARPNWTNHRRPPVVAEATERQADAHDRDMYSRISPGPISSARRAAGAR